MSQQAAMLALRIGLVLNFDRRRRGVHAGIGIGCGRLAASAGCASAGFAASFFAFFGSMFMEAMPVPQMAQGVSDQWKVLNDAVYAPTTPPTT